MFDGFLQKFFTSRIHVSFQHDYSTISPGNRSEMAHINVDIRGRNFNLCFLSSAIPKIVAVIYMWFRRDRIDFD